MIALGYGAGLRRTEIAGFALEDLKLEGAGMTVKVTGKGTKERLGCMAPATREREGAPK